jgi:hypothetical protein
MITTALTQTSNKNVDNNNNTNNNNNKLITTSNTTKNTKNISPCFYNSNEEIKQTTQLRREKPDLIRFLCLFILLKNSLRKTLS